MLDRQIDAGRAVRADARDIEASRWLAVTATLLAALALPGCGGGTNNGVAPPAPIASPPPVTLSDSAGVVELEISGIGTGVVTSSLNFDGAAALRARALSAGGSGADPQALTNLATGLDIQLQSASSIDVGTRGVDGVRYISATYRIRNAQFCATPGSCTAYGTARQNLTFLGVITGATLNQSAVSRFIRFDGSAANPALATQLVPTHGMNTTATAVDGERASLQVYRESELPATDASAISVLPYGFVVRNASDGSRTLSANPAAGQFDGRVTFAFRIPMQANAQDDPFKISLRFQVAEDSSTRVTQSLQEASFSGDQAAATRATVLNAADLVVPCGRLTQQRSGNPICDVRIAGLPGSATATTMGAAPATPQVVSAPSNLNNLPTDTAVVLGTSAAMNAPTAATLVVDGSQSGRRTLTGAYAGALDGGGSSGKPNQLIFKLNPTDRPFFRGETVSFVGTGGNTAAAGGAAMAPFVGSFRTVGSVAGSSGTFLAAPQYGVGRGPQAVAVGDLNGDGYRDLVAVNGSEGSVSVRLGNGTGWFAAATAYAVGAGPLAVVLGDVNADGWLDIVTANASASTVSVLLGNGSGGFGAAIGFPVGSTPISLALGHVNRDGTLDVVTANRDNNTVSVLLGNGLGSFGPATGFPVGSQPFSVTLGDLNGDSLIDVVTADFQSNAISILLGNGDGGFGVATALAVGSGPLSVVLGDFNGDGRSDIVTANATDNTVSVALNNGASGFAAAVPHAVAANPHAVAVGDINRDGHLDIVTANHDANTVSVLIGNGVGAFAAATAFAVGKNPQGVVLVDVNGDDRLDILTANSGNDTVSVLLGEGTGDFAATLALSTGANSNVWAITLGDVNGDGWLDIVTANDDAGTVSIFMGNGAGLFATAISYSVGSYPRSVALGDLNGDGWLDVITANEGSNDVSILLGDGTGAFAAATALAVGPSPRALAIADVDGDGRLDIVASLATFSGSFAVLRGDGTGGFASAVAFAVSGWYPYSIALADVNGDGRLDVVTANYSSNTVSVMLGTTDGTFNYFSATSFAVGSRPISIAIGDLNDDGRLDIVTANYQANTVTVLLGDGAGGFGPSTAFPVGAGPWALTLGDVNGDGRLDALTADVDGRTASVLLGTGTGAFAAAVPIAVDSQVSAVTLGDVNGDARLDAVIGVYGGPVILRGR